MDKPLRKSMNLSCKDSKGQPEVPRLREDVREDEGGPDRGGEEDERRRLRRGGGGRGTAAHPLRVQLEEEVEARVEVDARRGKLLLPQQEGQRVRRVLQSMIALCRVECETNTSKFKHVPHSAQGSKDR